MKLPPKEALEIWGLRLYGRLRSAGIRKATGNLSSFDIDAEIALTVETFFEGINRIRFRDLAVWVFANGQPPSTYRFQKPGETKLLAVNRLQWGPDALAHPNPPEWAFQELIGAFSPWWNAQGENVCPLIPLVEQPKVVEPKVFTTAEAAVKLKKSPGAVAMLLERGKLKGYRFKSRWMIPESAVLEFLGTHANSET